MTSPTVRFAVADDIPNIVRFNLAMAKETEGIDLEPTILEKGVSAIFEHSELGFYIVVEHEGHVKASLMITYEWSDWRNALFWWIQSVYVEPQYRRQGLYKKMYNFIKDVVKDKTDVAGIRLYVDGNNHGAQKTYNTLGMSPSNYQLFEYSKKSRK